MSTLIFDTETTGLVNFSKPDNDPSQPRLVQLGMMVLSDDWEVMHEVGLIVRPSGFPIPEQASRIHGIDTAKAVKAGVALETALHLFKQLVYKCDTVVAHNIRFDRAVLESEFARIKEDSFLHNMSEYCTMLATQPILKLPQSRGNGYKWPKLSEAYSYFFNEELVDAHDALTDVRACARIYKHLMTVGMSASQPVSDDNVVNDYSPEAYSKKPSVLDRGVGGESIYQQVGDKLPSTAQPFVNHVFTEKSYMPVVPACQNDSIQQQIANGVSAQVAPGTPV